MYQCYFMYAFLKQMEFYAVIKEDYFFGWKTEVV